MADLLKNKSVGHKIGLLSAPIGLVTAIIYIIYTLNVNMFVAPVFIFLLLGVASVALTVFTDWDFAPLIPAILFIIAFCFHANDRVIMFEEILNGIYGMQERGGNFPLVCVLLGLNLVSIVASMIAAFSEKEA